MTTESESSRGGSSDELDGHHSKTDRNGSHFVSNDPPAKRKRLDSTRIIQIANIAPQTTKEQMQALFGFLGKMDDIRLYPTMDIGMQLSSKICFIKFYDSSSVSISQHLTNTVFIDRALVVIPFMESEIPDENRGLELLTSGTVLPGIADPKLPQHVTSQLEGIPPSQVVGTYDPKLAAARLPMYPSLPTALDGRKIEEIRRTIIVANVDSAIDSQTILDLFNQCGEVKYFRLCTRDNDPLTYALIEFTEQPSILAALRQNGAKIGTKFIKVFHATQAIIKPQAKTNEAAQKEIEDAMLRQAQTIMSQGIDVSTVATPHLGAPVIKEKSRRSRSRHRSKERRRSRSRSKRKRSRSSSRRREFRHRSRDRMRVSRRRSRSRDHYKRRSPSLSPKRRSRSREDRKRASSSRKHDKKRDKDKDKDDKKDRKDDKKDRDKDDKRDSKDDRKDKERDDRKERRSEKSRDKDRDRKDKEKDKDRDKDRDRDKERSSREDRSASVGKGESEHMKDMEVGPTQNGNE